MATTLRALQRQAEDSARVRGHLLSTWAMPWNKTSARVAQCKVCCAQAYITTKPAPNQTNVMGSAVAVNCTGRKDR